MPRRTVFSKHALPYPVGRVGVTRGKRGYRHGDATEQEVTSF